MPQLHALRLLVEPLGSRQEERNEFFPATVSFKAGDQLHRESVVACIEE